MTVFLVLLSSVGIPAGFTVGLYIGRTWKYEEKHDMYPTPLADTARAVKALVHTETETEPEVSRSEMQSLMQD